MANDEHLVQVTLDEPLDHDTPALDELLPTPELRVAYEEASAALEAGRYVRALRKKAGLTQGALAARLSITQARISAIEAGAGRDGPSYGLLKRIMTACGTSLEPILEKILHSEKASKHQY